MHGYAKLLHELSFQLCMYRHVDLLSELSTELGVLRYGALLPERSLEFRLYWYGDLLPKLSNELGLPLKNESAGKPLTDADFWKNYWGHHHPTSELKQVFFDSVLDRFPKGNQRFIELGGFPGQYAAFFKKQLGYDVTLLDFHADPSAVAAQEALHGFAPGSIRCVQGDLFALKPDPSYDVVFSAGFIEHFKDPLAVLKKHTEYLAPGGFLFVSVPNLLGVSGWVQKWMDQENYQAHDLKCMDPNQLRKAAEDLGLEQIRVEHLGSPHLWLDHPERFSRWQRVSVHLASMAVKKVGLFAKGKWISPFLLLTAQKPTARS